MLAWYDTILTVIPIRLVSYHTKGNRMSITSRNYQILQQAYSYMNKELFEGQLPDVVITMQRVRSSYGYYWAERFTWRNSSDNENEGLGEIALNPDLFLRHSDEDIVSTLVHEMCHVWQHHFGTVSRNGYHNAEFATKMELVGLQPMGRDGKRTGQNMDHKVIAGGLFQRTFKRMVSRRNWSVLLQSSNHTIEASAGDETAGDETAGDEKAGDAKPKSKQKFTCLQCKQNAWAKPSAHLMCGDCLVDMTIS